jgi:predicted nuclease with RNAse H fold
MSNEGVEVVSTHPTAIEAIPIGAYCAIYEMACRRLHQGWRIEAPCRR